MRPPSATGARQTDGARAQGISPALLGRRQRQALEQAVPSSAEREEIKRSRAELRRVEMERDILKKVVTIFAQPPQSGATIRSFGSAWRRGPDKCSAACCASAAPAITGGGAVPSPHPRRGGWWRKRPSRVMPGVMVPGACGRNCVPKATPWDAMRCARGCIGTGYKR